MGYFTCSSQIVSLLAVNLLQVLAITTRLEQELSVSKNHRHSLGTLPIPEWELGLREAIYQALLNENKLRIKNLHEFIHSAPLLRRQNNATPFGDIVILGRGQLYSAPGGFQLLQDYYTNDCDGCHNTPPRCDRAPCENWKPQEHERLLALWTAKRIRHRDSQYGYRYEFEYKISPMSMVQNERFVTRHGNFDYSVSGYTFVVRVDPRQTSHRFHRNPNQAYDFFDVFSSPTWTPSPSSNYDNFYLPPPIPTTNVFNDPDPRKEGLPDSLYNAPNYNNNKPTTESAANDKEFENELFNITTSAVSTTKATTQRLTTTKPITTLKMRVTQPIPNSNPPFLPTINTRYPDTTIYDIMQTTLFSPTSDYVTYQTKSTENVKDSKTRTTRITKSTKPYPIYSSTIVTQPVPTKNSKPFPIKTTKKYQYTTKRFQTTENMDTFDIFGNSGNGVNQISPAITTTIATNAVQDLQDKNNKKPNIYVGSTLQSDLFDNFDDKLPTHNRQDENLFPIKLSTTSTTTRKSATTRKTSATTRKTLETTKKTSATTKTTSATIRPILAMTSKKPPATSSTRMTSATTNELSTITSSPTIRKISTTKAITVTIKSEATKVPMTSGSKTLETRTQLETSTAHTTVTKTKLPTSTALPITTEEFSINKYSTSFVPSKTPIATTIYSATKVKTFSPFKTMIFSVPLTTSATRPVYSKEIMTKPIENFDASSTTPHTTIPTIQGTFETLPTITTQNNLISMTNTIFTPMIDDTTTQEKIFLNSSENSSQETDEFLSTITTSMPQRTPDVTMVSDNTMESTINFNIFNVTEISTVIPTYTTTQAKTETTPLFNTISAEANKDDINIITKKTTKLSIFTVKPIVPTRSTKLTGPSDLTTPTNYFFITKLSPKPTTQQIRPITTVATTTYVTEPTNVKPEKFSTDASKRSTVSINTDDFLFNNNIGSLPKPTQTKITKDNFYYDIFGENFTTKFIVSTSKTPFKTKEIDDIFGKEFENNNKHSKIKIQSFRKPKSQPEIIYSDFYLPSTTVIYNKYENSEKPSEISSDNLFKKEEIKPTEVEHLTSQSYITSVSYKVNKKNLVTTETYDKTSAMFNRNNFNINNNNDVSTTNNENSTPPMLIACNESHPKVNDKKTLDALALTVLNNAKSITYLNSKSESTTAATLKYKRRNGYKMRKFKTS